MTYQDRLFRFPQVQELTGLSRSSVWRRESQGRFPKRVQLGGTAVAWRESELMEWLADPENYRRAGEGRAHA